MKNYQPYFPYSEYLKKKYGEKVYKLPVNLPVTCPNRIHGRGCTFCSELGTGFESMRSDASVKEQLTAARQKIEKKYHASKFIAYFQNYTNTFLPVPMLESCLREACKTEDIVEIAISTRPDCISEPYLQMIAELQAEYSVQVTIELGLQTVNYHTLERINRGHSLAEFIDAVMQIRNYRFDLCTHIILNLPWDDDCDAVETAKILSSLRIEAVKVHSLYIAKNTQLCHEYENGTIAICSKEEYLHRLCLFLDYLSPETAVERLFSRIPEKDAVFCNWNCSWWKLKDELLTMMQTEGHYQGRCFHYLNGAALNKLNAVSSLKEELDRGE